MVQDFWRILRSYTVSTRNKWSMLRWAHYEKAVEVYHCLAARFMPRTISKFLNASPTYLIFSAEISPDASTQLFVENSIFGWTNAFKWACQILTFCSKAARVLLAFAFVDVSARIWILIQLESVFTVAAETSVKVSTDSILKTRESTFVNVLAAGSLRRKLVTLVTLTAKWSDFVLAFSVNAPKQKYSRRF